ncbi:hypothetical protein AVEN_53187-1 [Araneus ventricosus]|uniref:Aspartic peptidase DDI1-type domain-containing protein n=1 Tax=Araneus ventricosus TaxID=182803 RepID=A0A4Y2ABT3_ARAVE|nr:hypothetical protein AVEN_53187-1 [Araneus ventricosus]
MTFLGLARKKDLQVLATELGLPVSDNFKIIQLRDLITCSEKYEEEFVKNLLSSIADERKMAEQAAEKDKELAKKEKLLQTKWIPYLISSLPTEIAQLIAREDEEDSQDYPKVEEMLLKRYSLIVLKICGVESAVCADIGASHAIAGEKLFHMLQNKKVKFKPKTVSLTLDDGTQNNVAALTIVGDLKVEGKVVPTELILLPEAKRNRTLLGTDFLQSAGIVLDVLNGKWHFCENPQIQYPFYKVPSKNENSKSISDSEKEMQKLPVLLKFLKRHLL